MELKICSAFIKSCTAEADDKSVVRSISNEIDKQYSLHATQLFTQADGVIFQSEMMEVKTDVSKAIAKPQLWMINAILTAICLFAAFSRVRLHSLFSNHWPFVGPFFRLHTLFAVNLQPLNLKI